MKKTIATASAGALLCILALAGCGAGSSSANGAGGNGGSVAATVTAAPGQTGASDDGVPTATPTGVAAVDSELNTVDQQLGVAGGDLAQATQSPSDGG